MTLKHRLKTMRFVARELGWSCFDSRFNHDTTRVWEAPGVVVTTCDPTKFASVVIRSMRDRNLRLLKLGERFGFADHLNEPVSMMYPSKGTNRGRAFAIISAAEEILAGEQ